MESTTEKLDHLENLVTILIDGIKRIEDKKIEFPKQDDYNPTLESMQGDLKWLREQNDTKALQEQVSQQVTVSGNLISAIDVQKTVVKGLVEGIPKKIKAEVEHKFSDESRIYIWVFVGALFITALSIVSSIYLLARNADLYDNSIKYRAVRMRKPTWALVTDSAYFSNPDSVVRTVKAEEERLLALEKAEEDARQRLIDAEAASQRLEGLKKQ